MPTPEKHDNYCITRIGPKRGLPFFKKGTYDIRARIDDTDFLEEIATDVKARNHQEAVKIAIRIVNNH